MRSWYCLAKAGCWRLKLVLETVHEQSVLRVEHEALPADLLL